MQESINENELVAKLKQGDSFAFDKIFNIYSHKLYGFALRYLKSEADAEELVHNVFVKIWEKHKTINLENSFQSFLFTITYNDILKFFRSKAYYNSYVNETKITSTASINYSADRVEYASVIEYIDTLIEKLPEKRKQIFIKSRKEGLSSKEIAKELHMTSGTVDNNISEAIKFIKNHIKKESTIATVLFIILFC